MGLRTTGLPYHLLFPLIALILLAIPSFASADGVWYLSAATASIVIRFGAQDYFRSRQSSTPDEAEGSCGYTVNNLVVTGRQGCIQRGYGWEIPSRYFGFPLPGDVNYNLSRVAVTSVIAFSFVLASGLLHAYSIRYSFRVTPAPNKDKLYSLVQLQVFSVGVTFMFTLIAFIAQAAIIGNATGYSGDIFNGERDAVAIKWGQSPWLVLGAGVVMIGWGYEAVRWRTALLA